MSKKSRRNDHNAWKGAEGGFIPFMQYMRPTGKPKNVRMHTKDKDAHAKAMAIIENGFTFEAEMLPSDVVSLTITHTDAGDLGHKLVRNGKGVSAKVHELINEFDIVKATTRVSEDHEDGDDHDE